MKNMFHTSIHRPKVNLTTRLVTFLILPIQFYNFKNIKQNFQIKYPKDSWWRYHYELYKNEDEVFVKKLKTSEQFSTQPQKKNTNKIQMWSKIIFTSFSSWIEHKNSWKNNFIVFKVVFHEFSWDFIASEDKRKG